MTSELAHKINSSACAVWLFREGLVARVSHGNLRTVRDCSTAQIETAIEHIEAENRDSRRLIRCTLSLATIPGVKTYADSLEMG
jgi:hypothetical protein